MQPIEHKRSRAWLILGLVGTIALGLASRKFPALFPSAFGKYPGDALWALTLYIGIAILKPNLPPVRLAVLALGTSFLVEFTQLYQAPWINTIRATTLGHLVLGSMFVWQDLCAYTVGVALGVVVDITVACRKRYYQSPPQ